MQNVDTQSVKCVCKYISKVQIIFGIRRAKSEFSFDIKRVEGQPSSAGVANDSGSEYEGDWVADEKPSAGKLEFIVAYLFTARQDILDLVFCLLVHCMPAYSC